VVYNLIGFGLVIMVFVIFVPRGLAGIRRYRSGRLTRGDAVAAALDKAKRREVA
jgi:hypothetical protein